MKQLAHTTSVFAAACLLVSSSTAAAQKEVAAPSPSSGGKVVLQGLAVEGVDENAAKILGEALAEKIGQRPGFEAMTSAELKQIVEAAAERQMLGCGDPKCMAKFQELTKADYIVSGSIGKVGSELVVGLSLVDARSSLNVGRASTTVVGLDKLPASAPALLAQLFGWDSDATAKSYTLPEGSQLSFAVLDLAALGVDEGTAVSLTQVLASALKEVEGTSVVSRDDIMAMLQMEQEKQTLGCDDTGCLAEIGGALGVDKLVAGTVSKLAERFIVSLRLIDARQSKVDYRVTESFQGTEEQLVLATRTAARKLIGVMPKDPGGIVVTSPETGLEIFVDDEARGEVPMPPISGLAPGLYRIRATKAGYYDWQSDVYVEPNTTTPIWATLEPKPPKFYQRWWFWTAIGTAVVGGITAWVVTSKKLPGTDLGTVNVNP